jgi:hypothetical protein
LALSDLIDVKYIDNTGYPAIGGTTECIGGAFWHYWGPANQLIYLRNSDFPVFYPNQAAAFGIAFKGAGQSASLQGELNSWANLFQSANLGSPYIEAFRVVDITNGPKYCHFNVITNAATAPTITTANVTKDGSPVTVANSLNLMWRYPGVPPASFTLSDTFTIVFERDTTTDPRGWLFTLLIYGSSTTDVIERHTVSVDPNYTLDGNNVFIDSVLAANSQYFRSKCDFILTAADGSNNPFHGTGNFSIAVLPKTTHLTTMVACMGNSGTAVDASMTTAKKEFGRFEMSRSTIILQPTEATTSATKTALTSWLAIAKKRNNVHIFSGVGIGQGQLAPVTLSDVATQLGDLPQVSADGKWGTFYVARELFNSFAGRLFLNGIGTIAAATVSTALAVNRNQPASAQQYGGFPGVLYDSLDFDVLLHLHEEKNVGGVYAATTGPQIFNVRTLFSRQTSYFSKLNCMRVIEAILGRVINAVFTIIHTPTAADPIQRALFQSQLTSILTDFMPSEILPDSFADVSASLNNDTATHGGEILHINLNLHLMKVVERVKISVIATDSSVTVQY